MKTNRYGRDYGPMLNAQTTPGGLSAGSPPGCAWLRLAAAAVAVGLLAAENPAVAIGTYVEPEVFLAEVFDGEAPAPSQLWLTGARRTEAAAILGHPYAASRIRIWRRDDKRVFILEEIGKERPITAGFVVAGKRLTRVAILIFRETRGDEVRHDFFTRQFDGAALDERSFLDRRIDGISGATLSVKAIEKLARFALWLAAEDQNDEAQNE